MQPYREFREDMQFEMGFKDWIERQKPHPKEIKPIELPNIYAY